MLPEECLQTSLGGIFLTDVGGQAQGLMVLDVTTKEAEEVPGNKPVRSILHSLCLERLPDLQWWTVTWSCKLKQILPFQVAVGHGFIKVE